MHGPAYTVPGDLHHSAVRMRGKAVIPGALDLGAEDGKTLRQKGFAVHWSEMEDRMPRRVKFRCEPGERVRGPGAESEEHLVRRDHFVASGNDSSTSFEQAREGDTLSQLHAEALRFRDQTGDRFPTFDEAAFGIVGAAAVPLCVPRGKSRPDRGAIEQLRTMPTT